jgi:hypothetical protein
MAENFGASYSENDLHTDESVDFTVPEKKPMSKMEMLARRATRMLLTLVMVHTSIGAAASTNSSYTSPANAYEYQAADFRFESILNTPDRLKAAQYLAGSLSYAELNGGALDTVSLGLYGQMTESVVPAGYKLAPEDYTLLINIERATHGAMIDVTNRFTQYVGQYYVNNPQSYDAHTKDWGIDALVHFRDYLSQYSIVTQADGTKVDIFNGALGWVFDGALGWGSEGSHINQVDISQTNQRLREVMNLIMAMQANIEKMGYASEFGKNIYGPQYGLLDRRAGVDEVRAALEHINKKKQTRTIRMLLDNNFSNNNLVWVGPVGPEDSGHWEFIDNAGNLVLPGRFNQTGQTEYYDIGSGAATPITSIMSPRVLAAGGRVTEGEFDGKTSWFQRFVSCFDIDMSVTAGMGIGVQYGGGSMPSGWRPSGTRWNPYNGWGQSDPGWREMNNGEVWGNVWHSTVYGRAMNTAENHYYKRGHDGVSGTANTARGYTPTNPGPNSGKTPIKVKGNASGR